MGWFYGFKAHLVINQYGQLVNFALTSVLAVSHACHRSAINA